MPLSAGLVPFLPLSRHHEWCPDPLFGLTHVHLRQAAGQQQRATQARAIAAAVASRCRRPAGLCVLQRIESTDQPVKSGEQEQGLHVDDRGNEVAAAVAQSAVTCALKEVAAWRWRWRWRGRGRNRIQHHRTRDAQSIQRGYADNRCHVETDHSGQRQAGSNDEMENCELSSVQCQIDFRCCSSERDVEVI